MSKKRVSGRKYEYYKVSIDKKLGEFIERFVKEYPEYGYGSVTGFIEEAIRRRAEELNIFKLVPRFVHINTFEDHVKVEDKKLDRVIEVRVKPANIGNKFTFFCDYCQSEECPHVKFVVSIRKKTIEPIEKRGWKYIGPTFDL